MVKSALNFSTSIFSFPSDITDKEMQFFTQLIFQSCKVKFENNKTPLQTAIILLKDQDFITESCKAIKGFLTHNPKIFDAKVKARVFSPETNFIKNSSYIYTDSIVYHHQYDWAGNAKYISKRYFLCTEFIHKERNTTLYHEFLQGNSELIDSLVAMGLTKEHCELIRISCQKHSDNAFPDSVPPYQVQVLVPYSDEKKTTDYISVSPVSASKVQAAIHSFCMSDNGH